MEGEKEKEVRRLDSRATCIHSVRETPNVHHCTNINVHVHVYMYIYCIYVVPVQE